MQGLVDVEKESARLNKDRDKALNDLKRTEGKLANEKFLANAPAEVINKEKDKQESFKATLEKITASLDRLSELA
jgi:valyl-tRNA synthetase